MSLKTASKEWYKELYDRMTFDVGFEAKIKRHSNLILKNKSRYELVASKLNIPWYFIGCIHMLEAACNFLGCLHNGERIIGTVRKTRLVPKGRGPFATWEESAEDALKMKGLHLETDWSLENILKISEAYNGLGYIKYHPEEKSPYLWACTSIDGNNKGKYTEDGKFDKNAPTNGQVGVAALLRQLEMDKEIVLIRMKT